MSSSLHILAEHEALSLAEKNKRKDQSQKRPRVHQKIQNYFKGMLDGQISPILRLKINRSLLDKNLDKLIEALDPQKHLIILDTNGWTFDTEKAKWFASLGGYKAQISLDSMIEAEHDSFRGKKGSYKRVMRALEASKDAGLELLISTILYLEMLLICSSQTWMIFSKKDRKSFS